MSNEVVFRNRAWKGTRVCNEKQIIKGNMGFDYEIMWHVCAGMFALEEQYSYLDQRGKPTFGHHVAYSPKFEALVKWIENKHDVIIVYEPETKATLESQIAYDIQNGAETLRKYPKWNMKDSITDKLIIQ